MLLPLWIPSNLLISYFLFTSNKFIVESFDPVARNLLFGENLTIVTSSKNLYIYIYVEFVFKAS